VRSAVLVSDRQTNARDMGQPSASDRKTWSWPPLPLSAGKYCRGESQADDQFLREDAVRPESACIREVGNACPSAERGAERLRTRSHESI
jgi:hypothetical protein